MQLNSFMMDMILSDENNEKYNCVFEKYKTVQKALESVYNNY